MPITWELQREIKALRDDKGAELPKVEDIV